MSLRRVRFSWGHVPSNRYVCDLLYRRVLRIGPILIAWSLK